MDNRKKHVPRSEAEIKQLKNRLHRITGQLNGIENMIEENRYCGDVLIQIAAVEKALQAFGYNVLEGHLKTCVTDEIRAGDDEIMDEVMELIKKLK
ncbi:metal-sensing transcriptional repressor [Catenisphaera adipataccumulans]|uniref:DNA-binding FrmR family transcriptional regulator n=1 Tax=Catenisphaera adipataccumulans TaxID=700500 RepID=A0A7W8FUW3_9FIRM|nr:metal-sensing transcriptional repressor [Catenisphaera adipataccumulans]MBB5182513.1 DNA-binding FrmR family transcriptional regulator [Catenisphaera adipataccumulans]